MNHHRCRSSDYLFRFGYLQIVRACCWKNAIEVLHPDRCQIWAFDATCRQLDWLIASGKPCTLLLLIFRAGAHALCYQLDVFATAVLICRRTSGEIQGVGSSILSFAIRWAPSGRIADHSHAWPYLLATDRAQSYSCRRHGFTPPRPRPAINHDHPSHPLSRDPPILTPLGTAKHCAHLGLSMSYDRTVSLTAPQRTMDPWLFDARSGQHLISVKAGCALRGQGMESYKIEE